MSKNKYNPQKGDIIWLNFSPQAGREQKGRRPALVVSSRIYNKHGLLLACPITSKRKGYPFEVEVELKRKSSKSGTSGTLIDINGVILADHVKNQDWKSRQASFISKVSLDCLGQVQSLIAAVMLQ